MKLLLLCLGLMLVHAQRQVIRSNFNDTKLSGKWYSVLLASDQKENLGENGMRIFMEDIQDVKVNWLAFKYHAVIKEKCSEVFLCTNKINDGVYTVRRDGYNIIHVVETIYDEYMVLYLKNENRGKTFQLLELLGRKPDLSPKLKEKFVEICKEHGIVQENILDLNQLDRCLHVPNEQKKYYTNYLFIILRFA